MRITPALLESALGCPRERAALFAGALDEACLAYEITTPLRLAHFLAQVGHESGALTHVREVWGPTPAQTRYEGRLDLGNTQPGDGRRYMGRGLLQTTGRSNHRVLRDRLRGKGIDAPDFEAAPDLLEQPKWAAMSAADYWDMRNINRMADADDFEAITRAINGGINGLEDRRRRLERVRAVLNAVDTPPVDKPAKPAHVDPRPDAEPYAAPTPEKPMVAPLVAVAGGFALELAKSLINGFAPLAKEKITKELARHASPEVAEQVSSALVQSAQAATGKTDPIDAVATARSSPAVMQTLEADALAHIDKLMPVLERMHGWEMQAGAAEEASRAAADERAKTSEKDQDDFLTKAIVGMVTGLMVTLVALIGGLMYLKADSGTIGTLVGLFAGAGGAIVGGLNTRIQHRYGSSRGSAAKDVMVEELARRKA